MRDVHGLHVIGVIPVRGLWGVGWSNQCVGLGAIKGSLGVICVYVGVNGSFFRERRKEVQYPLIELGCCLVYGARSRSACQS